MENLSNNKYNALVIGCGNIGALYDFSTGGILTHAKAFDNDQRFQFSVFDIDKELASRVQGKYNCGLLEEITEDTLSRFDCVSICTPTNTHRRYLEKTIKATVPLIICEKPVASNETDLNDIATLYKRGKSKIVVNYMRRFQPAYKVLRQQVVQINAEEKITNISIRYQRGFLNNCSHALDTIEFLTGVPMIFEDLVRYNSVNDHFDQDPTVSFLANCNSINVSVQGLTNVAFSFFEIDIFFKYYRILIRNSGQQLELYKAAAGERYLQPLQIQPAYSQTDCLINQMQFVVDEGHKLLRAEVEEDNFLNSVELNKRLLNYLK